MCGLGLVDPGRLQSSTKRGAAVKWYVNELPDQLLPCARCLLMQGQPSALRMLPASLSDYSGFLFLCKSFLPFRELPCESWEARRDPRSMYSKQQIFSTALAGTGGIPSVTITDGPAN